MDPTYANAFHKLARDTAMDTDSHGEWVVAMTAGLKKIPDIKPEEYGPLLDQTYEASQSNKIHRLKAIGAIRQQDAANAAKTAYTSEEEPANLGPIGKFARQASIGLTGSPSIKTSIHGLGTLGAAGGQALAAAASGGLSIPAALLVNAAGAGGGAAAVGAAADTAGAELINQALPGRDRVTPTYQPKEDFEGGALGSLFGGALSGAGGALRGAFPTLGNDLAPGLTQWLGKKALPVEAGLSGVKDRISGAASGLTSALKGYLGIKGPRINPDDQAALRVLSPDEKGALLTGHGGGEPGSAMIVPPKVRTDAVNGQRSVGLKALEQQEGAFDKASGDLVEGATKRQIAEKNLEATVSQKLAAQRAYDRQQSQLADLVRREQGLAPVEPTAASELQKIKDTHAATSRERVQSEGAEKSAWENWLSTDDKLNATQNQLGDLASRGARASQAAPDQLARLQQGKNAAAATVNERTPFALDESTPEGQAWRQVHDRTVVEPEDPELIGSQGPGNFPPVRRPETAPPGPLSRTGSDPDQLSAGIITSMSKELAKKTGAAVKPPPVTYTDVPRTPQQAGAAAVSPKAADLALPERQAADLGTQQILDALKEIQGRTTTAGAKVDDLGVQSEVAQKAAQRAADQAAQAKRLPDLSDPQLQAQKLARETRLRELEHTRGRIDEANRGLDEHFDSLSEAQAQEAQAREAANLAMQAHDPQSAMAAEEILRKKRLALSQFAERTKEAAPIEGGMSNLRHALRDLLGHSFPQQTFGIRAETPEAGALNATGRLFDTDRFPGGPPRKPGPNSGPADDTFTSMFADTDRVHAAPQPGPTYGPADPISDIFSNPPPSAADQALRSGQRTAGELFSDYLDQRSRRTKKEATK